VIRLDATSEGPIGTEPGGAIRRRCRLVTWFTQAAGHTGAPGYNLGLRLASKLDPPELVEARTDGTRAAEAGRPAREMR
jgi:hypothetical protein